ncbi:MAG: phosphatidylglycerol---prolipoprotein diacylglyceryl transferase [Phycisphaerales bacterium]|nr:phosphatidylglycerol---prolipoprotein diacylglyceryl transferase [Phycisphaerales bacterium]
MRPELFHIPGIDFAINTYGVVLIIGFLLALECAKFLARRMGHDPEIYVNAGIVALVAGVIGARLSHVIENWPQYSDPARTFWGNFFDAVNLRSGGLTFYGGLLLAFPVTIAYGLLMKVPIRRGMDIVAPCVMIGLGIGRVGCFLNGCCYGAQCETNFPAAVTYPYGTTPYIEQYASGAKDAPPELSVTIGERKRLVSREELRKGAIEYRVRNEDGKIETQHIALPDDARKVAATERSLPVHPSQLYSTFTALLIAAICICYLSLRPAPGRVMALMLMLEGPTRFILEMLRAEPAVGAPGLNWSLSMYIGVILFAAGVIMWFAMGYLDERRSARRPSGEFSPSNL